MYIRDDLAQVKSVSGAEVRAKRLAGPFKDSPWPGIVRSGKIEVENIGAASKTNRLARAATRKPAPGIAKFAVESASFALIASRDQ